MATYPYLVQIAWDVTNGLIQEWQTAPHRWERERDFQTELASRLRSIVGMLGRDRVDSGTRVVSRVTTEPPVYYRFSDGKEYRCYPDVAIRNDCVSDESDIVDYLWVCEIKLDPYAPSDWDVEKLRYLVDQGRVQFGCWLNLSRPSPAQANVVEWDRDSLNSSVWVCNTRLSP